MIRRRLQCLLALGVVFVCCASAADVPNISGTWHVNVEKSIWGNRPKLHSVTVNVEHREPVIKYSGTVLANTDDNGRQFEFEGAIDGKEYPYRHGMMVIRRLRPNSTISVYTSQDKSVIETARTTLSPDGKTMSRQIEAKGPEGTLKWTEIYERR